MHTTCGGKYPHHTERVQPISVFGTTSRIAITDQISMHGTPGDQFSQAAAAQQHNATPAEQATTSAYADNRAQLRGHSVLCSATASEKPKLSSGNRAQFRPLRGESVLRGVKTSKTCKGIEGKPFTLTIADPDSDYKGSSNSKIADPDSDYKSSNNSNNG